MKGEDDILEKRNSSTNSIMGSERSISGVSTKSGVSAMSHDARLLSNATSQATIAARSILVSGGTEDTAIRTAQAAAEAVLQTHHEGQRGKPNGFVMRRKIKKQAEVIASMALVNASNSVNNNNWEDLNPSAGVDEIFRVWQNDADLPKDASTGSKPPAPPRPTKQSRKIPYVKKQSNTPRKARTVKQEQTIAEEHVEPSILSDETSDPEISRPVAIRVETKKRAKSPFKALTPQAITIKEKPKTPVKMIQRQKSPMAASQVASPNRNQYLAASVPSEDPIYDMAATPAALAAASSDSDDDSHEDKLGVISSVSTNSADRLKKLESRGLDSMEPDGFMETTVDQYVFGCTDVFRCFGPSSASPHIRGRETDGGSTRLAFSESLADSGSGAVHSERILSNESSSSDDDGDFFSETHYEQHAISRESCDSSVESNKKPRTQKETLRERMKKIIAKSKGRAPRRVVQRRSVSSSFSSDGRDDYSSDSRDDIDSCDSDASSESSESEESRPRAKKSGGNGVRPRRHRTRNRTEDDAYV